MVSFYFKRVFLNLTIQSTILYLNITCKCLNYLYPYGPYILKIVYTKSVSISLDLICVTVKVFFENFTDYFYPGQYCFA